MKTIKKLLGLTYFAVLMTVLFSVQAFAYLDPGTLSYVISMIAGLFIAGGAAIAIFRRKIKLFFQNLGKKKQSEAEDLSASIMEDVVNPMEDVVNPMEDTAKPEEDKAEPTVEDDQ